MQEDRGTYAVALFGIVIVGNGLNEFGDNDGTVAKGKHVRRAVEPSAIIANVGLVHLWENRVLLSRMTQM